MGIQSQPGFVLGWVWSVGCFPSDLVSPVPLCRTTVLRLSGKGGAAHLESKELHIWYIQYFLKVTDCHVTLWMEAWGSTQSTED